MKRLFCLLALTLSLFLFASPVRDATAAKNLSFIEDYAPINYWSWPDAVTFQTAKPDTVWIPQVGVWYGSVAINGHSQTTSSSRGSFDDTSVTTTYTSGYSMGIFLPLPPGHYVLGCEVDGRAQFRMALYKEVDGGFQFLSYSIWSAKGAAGWYERTFTVPEEASLVMLMPTSSQSSAPPLTVTNIEIYRID